MHDIETTDAFLFLRFRKRPKRKSCAMLRSVPYPLFMTACSAHSSYHSHVCDICSVLPLGWGEDTSAATLANNSPNELDPNDDNEGKQKYLEKMAPMTLRPPQYYMTSPGIELRRLRRRPGE
jgi:hypothetical protein